MDLQSIAQMILPLNPQQRATLLNQTKMGLEALLGMVFTHVDPSCVEATLLVNKNHIQPYGLAHGGVYASMGESE